MPTFVSAPLPDVDLRAASVLTVDAGDPSAVITQLVIHVSQDVPETIPPLVLEPPVASFGDAGGGTVGG